MPRSSYVARDRRRGVQTRSAAGAGGRHRPRCGTRTTSAAGRAAASTSTTKLRMAGQGLGGMACQFRARARSWIATLDCSTQTRPRARKTGRGVAFGQRRRQSVRRAVRHRDRRRRFRRLRARQPPERGPRAPRLPGRGGARGSIAAHPYSRRDSRHDSAAPGELGVRDRAAGRARRPSRLPAARPRARRFELHQRDDLHARPPLGLRRLGGARKSGLGLRGRAAGLSTLRGPAARGGCLSRQRRGTDGRRSREPGGGVPGLRRVRRARGPCAQSGLQRREPGRGRPLPGDAAPRAPLQRGSRVPAARRSRARTSPC